LEKSETCCNICKKYKEYGSCYIRTRDKQLLNSLLGGNKVNRLEKENAQLQREVDDLNEQIERLHTAMQKMKDNHARELNRTNEQHQQEVGNLKRILDKAYRWFPSFKRLLNIERECLQYDFTGMQQPDASAILRARGL